MNWQVDLYREKDGSYPVEQFLWSLPKEHMAKILQVIDMLREWGPTLPFPYSSQVKEKIRELRMHYGKTTYRILYYQDRLRGFVLLHALGKTTKKLPEKDIKLALRRMKDDAAQKSNERR